MRGHPTLVLLSGLLLLLALAPWALTRCMPETLFPAEIGQERDDFHTAVAIKRSQTLTAMRSSGSTVVVIVIDSPPARAEKRPSTPTVEELSKDAPSKGDGLTETATAATSFTPTATGTSRVIVIQSDSTSPSPSALPPVQDGSDLRTPVVSDLKYVQDIITVEMLAAQISVSAQNANISELQVELTENGITATGKVDALLLEIPLEAQGVLSIDHENLVVKVTSVAVGGKDVTELYGGALESMINSDIYALLPRRYVQSFAVSEGQVVVVSQMRR